MNADDEKLIECFAASLAAKSVPQSALREKVRTVRALGDYAAQCGLSFVTITPADAGRYRDRLAMNDDGGAPYNPLTVNNKIGSIRVFYRFLVRSGLACGNPFADVENMKAASRIPKNILSITQMGTLLDAIPVRRANDFKFKVIVELLYSTGARISEVESLTRDDVRLDEGYIVIYEGKTRKERRASLTEASRELLRMYLSEYPIPGERIFGEGARSTLDRWVNKKLRLMSREIGLPYMSAHGIRHSIATHLLQKGADIREVQEYLGHERIESTELYTRIFPDDLKAVVRKTHPREARFPREADE